MMSGSVQIRLGDMFDQPSDLIVLPCSTGGAVPISAHPKLLEYQLPQPTANIRLGQVNLLHFANRDQHNRESITKFFAYAASVQNNLSTPEAIRKIGVQLGIFTRSNDEVKTIAAPLLGAGTGGLESETVVDSLRAGFVSVAVADAVLVIYVRERDLFERLSRFASLAEHTGSHTEVTKASRSPKKPPATKPRVEEQRTIATNPESGQTLVRDQVFISYSHKDAKWLEQLQVHLKPLENQGVVKRWDDTRIKPGANWREEIQQAIKSAKVAVLLVSHHFLASDFIMKNELPPLLKAAETEGAVILSIIVSSCSSSFKHSPIEQFQAVNSPSRPLNLMPRAKQEAELDKAAGAIMDALKAKA